MKKILLPTDFTPCALAAEKLGIALAKKINAEIVFLHILITPVRWDHLDNDQEKMFPETRAAISKARHELTDRLEAAEKDGVNARKLLVFSDGRDKIHKYISSEKIDLVVMGSNGQYGFKEHILGSNTYSVLRRAQVPVIVVKESNTQVNLDKIIFATNFNERTGSQFKQIEYLAEGLRAQLKILYVNTPTYFMETNDILKIGNSFMSEFSSNKYEINIIDAFKEERGIIQFAQKENANGIAVITSGKSDMMQYFSPSITENLIGMLDLPVVSIKVK